MRTFRIKNLDIVTVNQSADRICYILYPFEGLGEWIEEAALKYNVSIATISGMIWDDDLTPWPAEGQPPGCPDFKGDASNFLSTLLSDVLPEIEQSLHIAADAERTLTGVSLSGLFTLWQWMLCDKFRNIISLSGSFWYDGFVGWLKSQPLPDKKGRAFFLLGDREAKAKVKAFQSVQKDTMEIVGYLHDRGIDDRFDLVPGNHYEYALQRLDRALRWMYGE